MATNRTHETGKRFVGNPSHPATVVSGNPVRFGQIPGVALNDEDADGNCTAQLDGVFKLSVKGENAGGNVAVAIGDILYYSDGDTPVLNKKTSGVRFGYALEAVDPGATKTIKVKVGY